MPANPLAEIESVKNFDPARDAALRLGEMVDELQRLARRIRQG